MDQAIPQKSTGWAHSRQGHAGRNQSPIQTRPVTFILGMVKHPRVAMSICCDVSSNTFMSQQGWVYCKFYIGLVPSSGGINVEHHWYEYDYGYYGLWGTRLLVYSLSYKLFRLCLELILSSFCLLVEKIERAAPNAQNFHSGISQWPNYPLQLVKITTLQIPLHRNDPLRALGPFALPFRLPRQTSPPPPASRCLAPSAPFARHFTPSRWLGESLSGCLPVFFTLPPFLVGTPSPMLPSLRRPAPFLSGSSTLPSCGFPVSVSVSLSLLHLPIPTQV